MISQQKQNNITHKNSRKNAIEKKDDHITGCLLDYAYFRDYYKIVAIDLTEQKVLDPDPAAIQQINFTETLDRAGNTRIFFILEKAKKKKKSVLDFSKRTKKVL